MKKIGLILKGLWGVIVLVFGGKSREQKVQEIADATLKVVQVLNKLAQNPLLDLITELTATGLDDKMLLIVREVLTEMEDLLRPKYGAPTAGDTHPTWSNLPPKSIPILEYDLMRKIAEKQGLPDLNTQEVSVALIKAKHSEWNPT